ncbi:RagB/SusD family nutrient uptake outer membrane protein [Chryseobacterium culicis]|uniref:RagB/SusD family nutrient uptake outer membrane protein n=1 Tax=Chryseobacterium culicis TaxID=680127 RepID=UPI0028A10CC5|nr:RagB/SusD family nutrient uptake outer membrane protein [Chryseobacterium culicis]
MKNLIKIFSIFLLLSCEKLIDVELPNNQIDTKAVFQDLQTANSALAALYAGIRTNSPIAGADLEAALSIYTDDLDEYSLSTTPSKELYLNQQIDTNSTIYNNWANAYKQIYAANAILEGVASSTGIAPSDKKWLQGEALLIRTIMFFYLNQLYGDIPYPETTDYNINQTLSKTASEKVLQKMEEDLEKVITMLSDNYRNAERIYPNKMVAILFLAKIHMAKQQWLKAEINLKTIIQSPLYQIETNLNKVFDKSGKHIIWQLKPSNNTSLRQATTYYFANAKPTLYALSPNLINAFSANDLRLLNWIAPVSSSGITYYRLQKYKNRDNTNSNEYSVVIRLEEVYLLLAETLTQQSKLQEAEPYLNAIRQRASLTAVSNLTKEAMIDAILLESRREFFCEMGHRFLDLKRMGKLNTLLVAKPNWKDFHVLWPIPQKEILLNGNLKPQNPGY